MRRRKKKSGDTAGYFDHIQGESPPPWSEWPTLPMWCSECQATGIKAQQRESPSGPTCKFGHGGAEGIPFDNVDALEEDPEWVREQQADMEGFEVREGDTLTIKYDGANLQIADYSSVKLDSAIYSRQLRPGEDPDEAFAQIYDFLRDKCLERAKAKLSTFAEELAAARRKARGE